MCFRVLVEYRAAAGHYERFPDLAAELVRLKVDVLMMGSTPAALAAKHATTTIPIVMVAMSDPVGSGLVASLARPGGNITGSSGLQPEVVGKQLEFLKAVLPTVSRVAVLWNPANPVAALMVREADVAAQALGVQLHLLEARGPDAFDSAFAAMTSAHAGALLILADPMFLQHRRRLAELAATSRLPTMHNVRAFVEAGGLLCYGVSQPDQWRRAATYVDKILKGAKPADLPVEQPTKFELIINLKTAEALGLTIPPTLRCTKNARYWDKAPGGCAGRQDPHRNSVHKSTSSWWLARTFLDGMRTESPRSRNLAPSPYVIENIGNLVH